MVKSLIVVAGPTAVGKTTLAVSLAKYYKTEIISADSRQFYREMDIGTAKPSLEELNAVKHHFINSHSITDAFNVGDYEREAIKLLTRLFKKHDMVIAVGGSGLFINALINGFDDIPQSSAKNREKLNRLFSEKGISFLKEKLKDIDPEFYKEVDLNNPQRLIRALEVYETTGKPFSNFRKKVQKTRPFNIIQIGLNIDRNQLYENINNRVDLMINNGLIKEVEKLTSFWHLNPLNTVGYSELFDFFDGNSTMDEAILKIKQNTRRFAKRQLTWFNKSENIKWFQPEELEGITRYLNSELLGPEHVAQKS